MTKFSSPKEKEELFLRSTVFYSFLGTISQEELKLEKLKNKPIPLCQILFVHYQKSQTFFYNKLLFSISLFIYLLFVLYLDIFGMIIPASLLFIVSLFYKREDYLISIKLIKGEKIEIYIPNRKKGKGKLFVQEINSRLRDHAALI